MPKHLPGGSFVRNGEACSTTITLGSGSSVGCRLATDRSLSVSLSSGRSIYDRGGDISLLSTSYDYQLPDGKWVEWVNADVAARFCRIFD